MMSLRLHSTPSRRVYELIVGVREEMDYLVWLFDLQHREIAKDGSRAYKEGRYEDAARLFEKAALVYAEHHPGDPPDVVLLFNTIAALDAAGLYSDVGAEAAELLKKLGHATRDENSVALARRYLDEHARRKR